MSIQSLVNTKAALVRIAIPHFCKPSADEFIGYGSSRSDAAVYRGLALSRCLGGILSLCRHPNEQILSIHDAKVLPLPPPQYPDLQLRAVVIDCHVFVTGDEWLQPELQAFDRRITVHCMDLKDPSRLPHVARDFLLQDDSVGDADLSVYLEDDLVIQDRLYFDKLLYFYEQFGHEYVLMPHRYEVTADPRAPRFFVDGPIDPRVLPAHQLEGVQTLSCDFDSSKGVQFSKASNPHSGSFAISAEQRRLIQELGVVDDGFIGPLETVATYTALQHFQVFKPCWRHRDFLLVEHGHPSFLAVRHELSD